MKKVKKTKKKRRIANNHLGMLAIAFVAVILLTGLIMQSQRLKNRLLYYDAKAASLKQSIEDEQDWTEEIEELKKYMQTDEYVEEVARDKLGLVKDNEIVFQEEE